MTNKSQTTIENTARETCSKLIPHTTSVHNVEVLKGSITEAEARGYRQGLDDKDMMLAYMCGVSKGKQYTECVKDLVEENKRLTAQVKAADQMREALESAERLVTMAFAVLNRKRWTSKMIERRQEFLDIVSEHEAKHKQALAAYDNAKKG